MKKLVVLFAAVLLLGACGGKAEPEKTGKGESAKAENGDFASAEIKMEGDKITSIKLDELKEGKSKKELGAGYNMKAKSDIGKEWNEQVEFLEKYIAKNGIDKVKVDAEGKPTENDVKTGVTISVTTLLDAAKAAQTNAK